MYGITSLKALSRVTSAVTSHFSGVTSYFTQTRNGVTEMTLLVSAELYMILRPVSNVVLLPC